MRGLAGKLGAKGMRREEGSEKGLSGLSAGNETATSYAPWVRVMKGPIFLRLESWLPAPLTRPPSPVCAPFQLLAQPASPKFAIPRATARATSLQPTEN